MDPPSNKPMGNRLEREYFQNKSEGPINYFRLYEAFTTCKDNEDAFKLGVCCFVYGCLLCTNLSNKVPLYFLSYVDDLDWFINYPWGTLCFDITMYSLRTAHLGIKEYHLSGFVPAVQYWAYECIPGFGKTFAIEKLRAVTFPRTMRWSSEGRCTHKRVIAFLENNPSVLESLPPHQYDQTFIKDMNLSGISNAGSTSCDHKSVLMCPQSRKAISSINGGGASLIDADKSVLIDPKGCSIKDWFAASINKVPVPVSVTADHVGMNVLGMPPTSGDPSFSPPPSAVGMEDSKSMRNKAQESRHTEVPFGDPEAFRGFSADEISAVHSMSWTGASYKISRLN